MVGESQTGALFLRKRNGVKREVGENPARSRHCEAAFICAVSQETCLFVLLRQYLRGKDRQAQVAPMT